MFFIKDANKNLIEIKKNIFISKDDPEFLEKYIHYNPNDSDKIYEYAKQLESKGLTVEAFEHFTKAAEKGHYKSKKILEKINKNPIIVSSPEIPKVERKEKEKSSSNPFLWIFALLLLLLFSGIVYYLFSNVFNVEKASGDTHIENNTTNVSLIDNSEPTDAEALFFSSIHSGIEYYKNINGVYPSSLSKLDSSHPNNYLSFIPKNYSYNRTSNGYELNVQGMNQSAKATEGLINLVYYEKTKEIGLLKGEELLVLYPVAYGRTDAEKLPSSDTIKERVVNPNGGSSVLGSRGLVLSNNFAIHGTDDPASISTSSTSGCLRLHNSDINELYPFVPKGTPFKVDSNSTPSNPTFTEGLPTPSEFISESDLDNESNPIKTYIWKK